MPLKYEHQSTPMNSHSLDTSSAHPEFKEKWATSISTKHTSRCRMSITSEMGQGCWGGPTPAQNGQCLRGRV
jgi:hypothetical protein